VSEYYSVRETCEGDEQYRINITVDKQSCRCSTVIAKLTGQTEGLKVGCGGKNKVFIKPLALWWMGGV
jgi:hypothetical protein